MIRPVKTYTRISTKFAEQPDPGTFGKHLGIDYATPVGTPVLAPANGTVTQVSTGVSGGKTIELRAAGKLRRFLHLSAQDVKVGQNVSEGQRIGFSGATGQVSGPHLHYDVRKDGTTWNASFSNYIDPEQELVDANKPQQAPGKNWIPAGAVGKDVILSRSVSSWRLYKEGTHTVLAVLNPKKNGGRYLVVGIDKLPNRVIINSPTYGRGSLPVDGDATFAKAA